MIEQKQNKTFPLQNNIIYSITKPSRFLMVDYVDCSDCTYIKSLPYE